MTKPGEPCYDKPVVLWYIYTLWSVKRWQFMMCWWHTEDIVEQKDATQKLTTALSW